MTKNKLNNTIEFGLILILSIYSFTISCKEYSLKNKQADSRIVVTRKDLSLYSEKEHIENGGMIESNFLLIDDSELYVYFPGGVDGISSDSLLYKFLKDNLIFPDSAKKAGIEGKVYVSFTINKNGKISNIEILKGLSPDIDKEVYRVISIMPDWNWSKDLDLTRRKSTKRTIPIKFSLK